MPWTKAVIIAPWGDVVSLASRQLSLLAGDTGDLLAQKAICYTFPDGFGFVRRTTGVLVCEDSIKVFSFPGLTYRGVRSLPGKARTASFGERYVAVGFAEGPVRVYDARDWSQYARFALGERASSLALSPDERVLAVGLRDKRLVLCELDSKRQRSLQPRPAEPLTVLSFSPDGARLLAGTRASAAVWTVADGSRERVLGALRGLSAAAWTSAGEIATAGAGGLGLVRLADEAVRGIDDSPPGSSQPPVDLAVSPDGRVLCTGAKRGAVRCYAKGGIDRRVAGRRGSVDAADPAVVVTPGRLIGHTGHRLTMQAHPHTQLPSAGGRASLRRHVLVVEGELTTPGWPEIAEVTIDEVRKGRLHLTILQDKSASVMADGRTDPFEYDTQVRLVWQAP